MNIIHEYLKNENRNKIISMFLDQGAWNWIFSNVGFYDYHDDTINQIGKAYIGPNVNFSDNPTVLHTSDKNFISDSKSCSFLLKIGLNSVAYIRFIPLLFVISSANFFRFILSHA